MSTTPDSAVREHMSEHRDTFLAELADWLRIPSVSADPARAADVRRSADRPAAALTATGFPVTEIWDTPGAPAVFAEWPSGDPSAPTVLVHGRHDVRPAAREDGRDTDPSEPVTRDRRRYARGAADDKGRKVRFTREGGSGPAADLRDVLGAPVLFPGISVPPDGWHSVDEKVEPDLLLKGVETAAYLWGDLAQHTRAEND